MKPSDYIIAQMQGTKPFLAQIVKLGDDGYTVIPDKLRYREEDEITVHKKDVLVRLGPEPKPGKVYGVDVANIYRKSFTHDVWGPVHFFVKPDKEHLKMLKAGLDITAKRLDKLSLTDYMGKFQTEIRAKKGKYAGMYTHHKDEKSVVWYAPECAAKQEDMNGVIYHEYGHVLRFNGLTRVKPRARWQRLFQHSIAPIVVPKKFLDGLLDTLIEEANNGSDTALPKIIKEYVAEDDTNIAGVKALQRWMRQIHHVSPRDIEVLWAANDADTLRSLWPKTSIDTSRLDPILTDYATKNVEELFAESFMFYALGKKIPSSIEKLLEKSLSEIKGNAS